MYELLRIDVKQIVGTNDAHLMLKAIFRSAATDLRYLSDGLCTDVDLRQDQRRHGPWHVLQHPGRHLGRSARLVRGSRGGAGCLCFLGSTVGPVKGRNIRPILDS